VHVSTWRADNVRGMNPVSIRLCSIAEIAGAPNFSDVCEAYAHESAVPGLPVAEIRTDIYTLMESSGNLFPIGAFDGEKLVGFIVSSINVMPNYGVPVAATNAYFVLPEYRSSGAGLRLLREAESLAKASGAAGMLIGCPKNGVLSEVLERKRFVEVNRLFFKGFA
jgi:GNAT superfamily N-acetyltransferase